MQPLLITVVQFDQGYNLNFTITDSQNLPINISGASLTFRCQSLSDFNVKFNNPMVIQNGPAGTCYYTLQANDFLVAGTYNAQITVTYPGGEVFSVDNITIVANPNVPQ